MRPRDGLFLKPLLPLTKAEIQRYLRGAGHAWREDNSNQDRKYKRNRVRLDLVPLMAALAGGEDALYRYSPRCSTRRLTEV